MKGRAEKVWIQKMKNSNLIMYVEHLLSYLVEQEIINMFQNILCRILLIFILFYQHTGLKFEEETSKMLHLEHGFVWC